jgi:hypothetical protein
MKATYAQTERDEINFERRALDIGRAFTEHLRRLDPDDRPPELVYLIDEEIDCFRHYDGRALRPSVGDTRFLDHEGGIKINLRHFYPDAPEARVALNERGQPENGSRLVPAALLSRDLKLDEILIGRFVCGITKHTSAVADGLFRMQILVMSVCGNGRIRENLTFEGHTGMEPDSTGQVSAFVSRDFGFVQAIFAALEDDYGRDGIEFLAHEVSRHRYYMSELLTRDIGAGMAFDAYLMQYGSYMSGVLRDYKDLVLEAAGRLVGGG